jgi:alpha-1,6-mannosyltransferase
VVGVHAGALVDRVPEGTGLLGPVGDAAAMAANVERVAAQQEEMGGAALTMVRETLSWEASFRTIFEAYESLIARPVASPLAVAA